jgi:predicted GH43/DUF377 family glycosyl hydrolase
VDRILSLLPDQFSTAEFDTILESAMGADFGSLAMQAAVKQVHWVADSTYEVAFDPELPISEHVMSPAAPVESHGMEDARFVRLTDGAEEPVYYATYTAFDGTSILPQLIETRDFNTFRIGTMSGPALHHKGVALFPRKLDGEYLAVSRHDHESLFLLRSTTLRRWSTAEILLKPAEGWELIQIGNCGSPLETDAGWLVITHGVGPMRRYVLGAILLDRDEPTKVLGRLRSPLLEPEGKAAMGYVPDVVYSCGSMIHAGQLIVPFGYADYGIGVATMPLDTLLTALV